jgi:Mannosylglycerate hydrolase MGH1-like glycoside hydrolase domain
MTREQLRLQEHHEHKADWKHWGPFLSERAWGTVREDYSANGDAWNYFPHEQARSRAYRWSEDGIAGISDRNQNLCFALALWNGKDRMLKERLFGLTGAEGNHGEDVKECYFYLDNTPTHSYMKYLYKYPQSAFPYERLVEENKKRSRLDPEFELMDTGIFDENRYFDVIVEYAKIMPDDFAIRITAINRGPEPATLHLLPTVWFRNVWSWDGNLSRKPVMRAAKNAQGVTGIQIQHSSLGERWLFAGESPELLFTENETNTGHLYGVPNRTPFVKDGINNYIVHGMDEAVNPEQTGSKASAHRAETIAPGQSMTMRLAMLHQVHSDHVRSSPLVLQQFEELLKERVYDADEFYREIIPQNLSPDGKNVMRQALAGLLWSKQFYNYDVRTWLGGDPAQPAPPPQRNDGRNHEWIHVYAEDVLSMPDKWEYPWFAAWDLAFQAVPLALVDCDLAKRQLNLLHREWYMHPNGQIPAYEWSFGDVNPPVHAWAALRVYQIERRLTGKGDYEFLESIFHKLIINFTWWVNRKDLLGMNIFQGGFLGLDNIGAFDRSAPLPDGGYIEQSDGTSWMAMYCLNLLMIALELAFNEPVYEDVANKFWEHFLYIVRAMNSCRSDGAGIWNEEEGFYYDVLRIPNGPQIPLKIRSVVGLIPLFAVQTIEPGVLDKLESFARRMHWLQEHRPDLACNVTRMTTGGKKQQRQLLSILDERRLRRVLSVMLDEKEFLSPFGIRSLSAYHRDHPFAFEAKGRKYSVDYEPAESTTPLFGGNSNWRGPVWYPMNYLIIESLQKYYHFFGESFKIECPTGSGKLMTLGQVAIELSHRLSQLFLKDKGGRRAVYGDNQTLQSDPNWRDLISFYEYFHGDTGRGLGASHQTGWTALVAKLIQQNGEPSTSRNNNRKVARAEAANPQK